MRPVVAKRTPRKQNTTEDKTTDADAEEVNPNTYRLANLNRFGNHQQLKKNHANLNKFEKRSENLKSQKTNHATSTATTSPPPPHHSTNNHYRNQTPTPPQFNTSTHHHFIISSPPSPPQHNHT
ncbi:hypothetical protein QL285_081612 [Trifolium repens]|nr:hypothetical protein QL285_081612 [Trifolium repens]